MRKRVIGVVIGAGLLATACGGGSTTAPSSGSPTASGSPALTLAQAVATAKAYFVADNKAQVADDTSQLQPIEEGPVLDGDQAQFNIYGGTGKKFTPFSATNVNVVVPADAGAFPRAFACSATVASAGTTSTWLGVFVQDSATAPWRVWSNVTADTALPAFARDSNGFGEELPHGSGSDLVTAPDNVAYGWANYIAKPLLGQDAASAPAVTFAPGPNTSQYLAALQADFNGAKQSGGTTGGTVVPIANTFAFRLQSGGAIVFFAEQTQYSITMGGSSTIHFPNGIDTFVTPGAFSQVTYAADNMLVAIDPQNGSGTSVSVPYASPEYTSATAT